MNINNIIEKLNDDQRHAVTSDKQHTLVLAGAGSGKTKVLIHRIAWLESVHNLSLSQIISVTFTNKAALEIKDRLNNFYENRQIRIPYLGTFHSISHRILRQYYNKANLSEHFTILDAEDTVKTIKKTLAELNLDENKYQPRSIANYIQNYKENGIKPQDLTENNIYEKQIKKIYMTYEEICEKNDFVDFTSLILKVIELLEIEEIKEIFNEKVKAICIDEFQDINALQYKWLQAFMHQDLKTFCVGDDDQSIYGWRGARLDLMHAYQDEYPEVLIVRLEQNYRSTSIILDAANNVISNNSQRLGKSLWTDRTQGSKIKIFKAYSDIDEAKYVIESIKSLLDQGANAKEIAILYRSNVQSRVFEEQCHAHGLSYRIYGGQRFFDRQEIKDLLAYIKLCFYSEDTSSIERIINVPNRAIGHVSMEKIRQLAKDRQESLWQTIISESNSDTRLGRSLKSFYDIILTIQQLKEDFEDRVLAEKILELSELIPHIQRTEKEHENKCENIKELLSAIEQFCREGLTLKDFVNHAALMHIDDNKKDSNVIQLMTLHAAKGLEFQTVFLVGFEEDLLPHKASIYEGNIEEERRLCYVGITRAQHNLYLCYAENRKIYGQDSYPSPSRFLKEIPSDCIEEVRLSTKTQKNYETGQTVYHARFGKGIVMLIEGQDPHKRMQVKFQQDYRWFLCDYAVLDII